MRSRTDRVGEPRWRRLISALAFSAGMIAAATCILTCGAIGLLGAIASFGLGWLIAAIAEPSRWAT